MVGLMAPLRHGSYANDSLSSSLHEKSASSGGLVMSVRQNVVRQLSYDALPADSVSNSLASRLGVCCDETLAASEDEVAEPLSGELHMQSCAICNGGACPCTCGAITPA